MSALITGAVMWAVNFTLFLLAFVFNMGKGEPDVGLYIALLLGMFVGIMMMGFSTPVMDWFAKFKLPDLVWAKPINANNFNRTVLSFKGKRQLPLIMVIEETYEIHPMDDVHTEGCLMTMLYAQVVFSTDQLKPKWFKKGKRK